MIIPKPIAMEKYSKNDETIDDTTNPIIHKIASPIVIVKTPASDSTMYSPGTNHNAFFIERSD
jgi:hypothetical protein